MRAISSLYSYQSTVCANTVDSHTVKQHSAEIHADVVVQQPYGCSIAVQYPL